MWISSWGIFLLNNMKCSSLFHLISFGYSLFWLISNQLSIFILSTFAWNKFFKYFTLRWWLFLKLSCISWMAEGCILFSILVFYSYFYWEIETIDIESYQWAMFHNYSHLAFVAFVVVCEGHGMCTTLFTFFWFCWSGTVYSSCLWV